MRYAFIFLCLACSCFVAGIPATDAAEPAFRTDDGDEKLPWFQPQEGEFPPPGSAHYFAGELVQIDHLERQFILRVDRTDKQNRSHFDLPISATMLPYGSVHYHGSPAALRDIPLGTHLHGWYYEKAPGDKTPAISGWHNRRSIEVNFTRCFRLEDDFTYYTKRQQLWRVDEVDLAGKKLVVTLETKGQAEGKPVTFDLQTSTRVRMGSGFAKLEDIKKDQRVLFNITWATLYGAGRVLDIWLDEASRQLSASQQLARHHQHVKQRGLPGWVDTVDNQTRDVTITIFGNVDPALIDDVKVKQSAAIAVARPSLMTFDPVNDRKSGPVMEKKAVAAKPGSSGVQIQVRPALLLEGYRPRKIVRVYPAGWPVIALPREEQYFGR